MKKALKKRGFTLIEVLGVIVVLAVIALITTPIIINVIDKAKKGALEDSAYGLLDSANIYYSQGILDETQAKTEFTFKGGIQTSENKLSYKGKVENGSVRLYSDGKTALCITGGEYAALKNVNDKKVSVTRGRCSYNSETEEYETRGLCQDLQDEIDALKKKHQEELDKLKEEYEEKLKQAGSDKEQLIKDHEDKIKTLTEAYEAQIKELNNQLNVFKNGGTATADQILSGKTAFVKGQLITGTIASKGATTYTPGTSNQTISSGQYLSGIQTIKGDSNLQAGNIKKGVSLFGITGTFTSDATATAADIVSGKIAYVKGEKVTGTMSNNKVYAFSQSNSALLNTIDIDITSIPSYEEFTVDNISVAITQGIRGHIRLASTGQNHEGPWKVTVLSIENGRMKLGMKLSTGAAASECFLGTVSGIIWRK